jgi:hypothetical protein
MLPEREQPQGEQPEGDDPDDIDLDAMLDDFADRSGPDPAREPGVDPAGGDDPDAPPG